MVGNVYRQRGFTLIELLLVVVLLSVTATMGAFAYQSVSRKIVVRSVSESLTDLITQAKINALTSGDWVALCPVIDTKLTGSLSCLEWDAWSSADQAVHWAIFQDNNRNAAIDRASDVIEVRSFAQYKGKVTISANYSDSSILWFTRKGQLGGKGGTITIQSINYPSISRKITILPVSGRVQNHYVRKETQSP